MIRQLYRFGFGTLALSPTICRMASSRQVNGNMEDCQKVKIVEKEFYALLNDKTIPDSIESANQIKVKLDSLRDEMGMLLKSCEAAQQAEREKKQKERMAKAVAEQEARQKEANENTPKFFNYLVDLVENGDTEMHEQIMRQIVAKGDSKIILYSSSEWDVDAYRNLSKEKKIFENVGLMTLNSRYDRNISKGKFNDWWVYSQACWKMSIFIIPTREQRIVMDRK